MGKRTAGDNKTPLGTYPLGRPRSSRKYKTFIPIGYPTAAQKRKGYTGSAIGIHGPHRKLKWAGWMGTLFGWTRGCVAVATDEAIGEIAAWVTKHRPRSVHLVRDE